MVRQLLITDGHGGPKSHTSLKHGLAFSLLVPDPDLKTEIEIEIDVDVFCEDTVSKTAARQQSDPQEVSKTDPVSLAE